MATAHRLVFPEWYDERAEWEVAAKGWFQGAVVQLSDGSRYAVTFYDPVRLGQDLEAEGRGYLAEVGLIVLPELTRPAMEAATARLDDDGYFKTQLPLSSHPAANGTPADSASAAAPSR